MTPGMNKKVGPGLFEFLDDKMVMPWDPTSGMQYEGLLPSEKGMFDGLGTKEEIEAAEKMYCKLRGPVSHMDLLVEYMKEEWMNKVDPTDRKIDMYTSPEGAKQFDKMIKSKYKQDKNQ